MKNTDKYLIVALVFLLAASVFLGGEKSVIAQGSTFVNEWLRTNTLATSDDKSLRVELANSVGDFDVTGDFSVDTTVFTVNATTDVVDIGAWETQTIATSTAQSYSISSSSKAGIHIQTHGAAATMHLMTDLLTSPGDGGVLVLKTGGANDVTIDTEGAEDIDGADTYSLDGTYEAVGLVTDGTNWFITNGYLE